MRIVLYKDADHSYTVDGVQAVSVTTIAKAVSGLSYGSVPVSLLETAKERGNAIHKDVESGKFETREGQFVAKQMSNKWWNEIKLGGFINKFAVAGTTDLIGWGESSCAERENCMPAFIADIKTTYTLHRVYCIIQLNLYNALFMQRKCESAEHLLIFHVPKSGKYKVVELPILSPEKIAEIITNYTLGVIMSEKDLTQTTELSVVAQSFNVSELTSEELFAKIGELTKNAEQAKQIVEKKLQDYSADNYSEENIQEAKDDKAALNNFSKTLNGHRIELEKKWLEPFDKFKGIIAETCGTVKEASTKIDEIVKVVNEREIEEKCGKITSIFEKQQCALFPLENIFNQKWLNKGSKLKEIEAEIIGKIAEVESNLKIIDRLNEPDVKAYYLETLDITSAMQEADRLKSNRERLAELEKEAQADKSPLPEIKLVSIKEPEQTEEIACTNSENALLERTFRVQATKVQLIALGDFMNANSILFEKL